MPTTNRTPAAIATRDPSVRSQAYATMHSAIACSIW